MPDPCPHGVCILAGETPNLKRYLRNALIQVEHLTFLNHDLREHSHLKRNTGFFLALPISGILGLWSTS